MHQNSPGTEPLESAPNPGPDEAALAQRSRSPVPRVIRAKRLLWTIVEATLFRCSFHTWYGWRAFLLRRFGASIGRSSCIRRTACIYYPWNLSLGDFSSLGDSSQVYNLAPITIGSRVTISQEAYLCAGSHDYHLLSMPLVTSPILIKDDAWICARAFINPGLSIGTGAIVAAGAVVVKSVDDWAIVGGNPAYFIKTRPRPVS